MAKSEFKVSDIPTSRTIVTGIGYIGSVENMLSPATIVSSNPQGLCPAVSSAEVSQLTPFDVQMTEESGESSSDQTARNLETLFKDLSFGSSSGEKCNKLMSAVSTNLDSETGTLILSCEESQTNGTIDSHGILVPKTSDAITDSFVTATKRESEGSDSDSVCSSKAVPKKVKELNILQEHARRTITIKLQIDERHYRFKVGIIKVRTGLFLTFILPTQSHLSSSRIQF